MSIEQYTNAPATHTTLNGAINNVTTSVVVVDGSVFPSTGIFRIIIEHEIMKVTARSSNTLTVVRADGSSTAVSHSTGLQVTQIVTKQALERANTVIAKALAYASLDSAVEANEGWLNFPTNVPKILRSDGSSWIGAGPLYPMKRPPDPAGMTWVNQGSSTATLVRETVYATIPTGTPSTDNWHLLVKSIPTAPYTVTMGFTPLWSANNFARAGMVLRNSGGNKFTFLGWDTNNITPDAFFSNQNWNSTTSFNGSVPGNTAVVDKRSKIDAPFVFFRIRDDNTNLFFEASPDYETWHLIGTQGRTTFFTADQIGWGMENFTQTSVNAMTVWSWLEE